MGEISLSELIEQTKESIRSFEYNRSTINRYQIAWRALTDYFIEHDQVVFSKQLAEQFVLESKTKLDTRAIKKWRYKLNRLTVLMLIDCYEYVMSHGNTIEKTTRTVYSNWLTFSCIRIISTISKKGEKVPVPSESMKCFKAIFKIPGTKEIQGYL